jgi:hypothetical protein
MICSSFWKGSGLGDQLERYVMLRCLAMDKGLEWGMEYPENFKGKDFMKLDMGLPVLNGIMDKEGGTPIKLPDGIDKFWYEQNIGNYDWEGVLHLKDNTKIDGNFQGELYWIHHLKEMREWLNVEPLQYADNICIINFRGGEFTYVPELFLPKEYWDLAINKMLEIRPDMEFVVHTDDPDTAKEFFPDLPCFKDISFNWRSVRYAQYLILANSSFGIIPAYLNENAKKIIAPNYWARRNISEWIIPYNKYSKFEHI